MSSTDLVFNIIGRADSAVKALHDVSDTAQQSTSKVKAGFKALAVVAGGAALAGPEATATGLLFAGEADAWGRRPEAVADELEGEEVS